MPKRPESRPFESRVVAMIDTGSPVVSVAIADGNRVLAAESAAGRKASERVLPLLDSACRTAAVTVGDLDGLVALRGPGSYTGLRVGLATILGLHQALGIPATAISTLEVLAAAAPPGASHVLAATDALRGEWMVQSFQIADGLPEPTDEPRLLASAAIATLAADVLVAFGVEQLRDALAGSALELHEPPPLAPIAARLVSARSPVWDPTLLTQPLYLRPPSIHGVSAPGSS